jgi:hypothetical protein
MWFEFDATLAEVGGEGVDGAALLARAHGSIVDALVADEALEEFGDLAPIDHGSSRCMTMDLALNPCASKKFLERRWPGETWASKRAIPRLRASSR